MIAWEEVGKPARARAALSHEGIATAAVAIADADGLSAVTMRGVAKLLGAGAMSLYRYVDSREDLIALMIDHVNDEAVPPPKSGDWRADLEGVARLIRGATLRHPWLTRCSPAAAAMGPNTLTMTEATLRVLDGHGLSTADMLDVWRTVVSFTKGYAANEIARADLVEPESVDPSYVDSLRAAGSHPLAVAALLAESEDDEDVVFERQLGYVLDGLAHTYFPHASS